MTKKVRLKIKTNVRVADATYRMTLGGDCSGIERPGQFVDIAIEGRFLRRPLAVTNWNDEELSVIYKVVGQGTAEMSEMKPGTVLDVLTGLGNGFDASRCKSSALVVCGGLGASPVFSLVGQLVDSGRKVTVVAGFNRASEMVLTDEMKALGADVHVATMDGSAGTKGLVTDMLQSLDVNPDFFYTCGPRVMMRAVCGMLDIPGQVSLEERMGCGCGICYGCTCHTKSGPRRVCADGPVFDVEEVIW